MINALILAGGLGTRLREETEFKPKPMVDVGGRPILWHIMKNLSQQGVSNFTIATGYKGDVIKDYFINYYARNNDITVDLGNESRITYYGNHDESKWKVTIANTGEATLTGGRVFKSKSFLGGGRFLCTYGDGLADINLTELISFHESHGRLATVTTVKPLSRFGLMEVDTDGGVIQFREKPVMDGWVNAGFFIFEQEIFEYLDAECTLESEPLMKLAADGQLSAYRHEGFWQPMDTLRESNFLNDLWIRGEAPWKNWS
jgi:glucose-1-phosphate cytidylyltransferase